MSKKYWIAKHPEIAVEPTDATASEANQEISVKGKIQGLKNLATAMEGTDATLENAGDQDAGTTGGKAANKVLKVLIDDTYYYIPLFDSNTNTAP
jgi:hypothetical protein